MAEPNTPASPDTHSSSGPAEGAAIDPPSPPSYGIQPEAIYVQAYNARMNNQTLSVTGARGSESNFTDTTTGRGPSSPRVEDHVSSIPFHQQHHPEAWKELPLEEETLDVRGRRIGKVIGICLEQFGGDSPKSGKLDEEFVSSEDDDSMP